MSINSMNDFALTADHVLNFREYGYLILRRLYTQKQIAIIDNLQNELYTEAFAAAKHRIVRESLPVGNSLRFELPGYDINHTASVLAVRSSVLSVSIRSISWLGGAKPQLLNFGRLHCVTIPVAQLLRTSKADHLINETHYTIPNDKVRVDWHQDIEDRRAIDPNWKEIHETTGDFIQVVTAIERLTVENGGFVVVPASHFEDMQLDRVRTSAAKQAIIAAKYDLSWQTVNVNLEPGDTAFIHAKLLYKNDENVSKQSAKIFINGFSFPGVNERSYPGKGSAIRIDLNVPADIKL